MRDRSCHPCLRTLLPRGGEKICIIDQDTFQNVEQRGRSFHFSPPPLLRPFCMFTKKRRSASFVCRSPPSSTFYPSTFLLSRSIFSYHMYIYIYIFSVPIQCFFSFFLFPHLSPPLPFFSVFLMLVHRSNHLFTYSFIYPPDLRIFIRSRTLGNSLGNSVTITVSDLLLFPQFVAWILLVEYSRFTRVFCKFIYKRFLNM